MKNHCHHTKRVTSPLLDELVARLERVLLHLERSSSSFKAMLYTDPSQKRLASPASTSSNMNHPNRPNMELPEAPQRAPHPKIADMQIMLELNQIHVRLGELIAELEREKGLRPRSEAPK